MTNIVFLPVQPAHTMPPCLPAHTGTITARIDGYPRNAEIIVALDANRILIRCTDITLSRWITAHDIIAPRRFGGAA
ncbi:hypothetical protein [Thalassospira sp.]|uniref:hypothetical protein n=1 Tax=Thalassospira sp. TaxID=1912094 RepID=UPI003AA814E3